MRKFLKPLMLCIPLMLSACGGGGGSGGSSALQYNIKLTASKTAVPVNLNSYFPGYPKSADYRPYMSTIYIQANEGGSPIPDKEENAFGCNVVSGLDSGSLYYLDGADEHTVDVTIDGEEVKVPGSYRSITLGSNSGGASFHVISKDIAGEVVVKCTVTDPRDGNVYDSTVSVKVGGGSTATPAGVTFVMPQSNVVGARDNLGNIPNQIAIEATVRNDANQPISNAGKPNLQVAIIPTAASSGSRLMAGGKNSSGSMQISTVNGIGQLSVAGGPKVGALLLQFTVDRADNDVSNGIQDAITQYAVLQVVEGIATSALAVDSNQLAMTVTSGVAFVQALNATGGVAPYTWSTSSALPTGLTLNSSGLISGTPNVKTAGDYSVGVTVKDANGSVASGTLVIKVLVPDTAIGFSISGCSSSTARCLLPSEEVGSSYLYSFSATGDNITWSLTGAPSWMAISTAGVVSSSKLLTCAELGSYNFSVTAKNSTSTVMREVSVNITDPSGSCTATGGTGGTGGAVTGP